MHTYCTQIYLNTNTYWTFIGRVTFRFLIIVLLKHTYTKKSALLKYTLYLFEKAGTYTYPRLFYERGDPSHFSTKVIRNFVIYVFFFFFIFLQIFKIKIPLENMGTNKCHYYLLQKCSKNKTHLRLTYFIHFLKHL